MCQQKFSFDEPEKEKLLEDIKLEKPLVFFDLETTGLDLKFDRIIQFAFLKIKPDKTTQDWKSLVKPNIPIPPEASQVHHITDEQVENKPDFKFFAPKIYDYLENCDIAGFNIARFDIPFLQMEMKRHFKPLSLKTVRIIDVQTIFHKKEPRDLTAAYKFYCGQDHIDAHDAMGDVQATLEIFNAQLEKYNDLPKHIQGLHDMINAPGDRWVTTDKKFYWRNNKAVISFGKHRGRSLLWVYENEIDYLIWLSQQDFPDETKQIIRKAVQGIFPQKNKDIE